MFDRLRQYKDRKAVALTAAGLAVTMALTGCTDTGAVRGGEGSSASAPISGTTTSGNSEQSTTATPGTSAETAPSASSSAPGTEASDQNTAPTSQDKSQEQDKTGAVEVEFTDDKDGSRKVITFDVPEGFKAPDSRYDTVFKKYEDDGDLYPTAGIYVTRATLDDIDNYYKFNGNFPFFSAKNQSSTLEYLEQDNIYAVGTHKYSDTVPMEKSYEGYARQWRYYSDTDDDFVVIDIRYILDPKYFALASSEDAEAEAMEQAKAFIMSLQVQDAQ